MTRMLHDDPIGLGVRKISITDASVTVMPSTATISSPTPSCPDSSAGPVRVVGVGACVRACENVHGMCAGVLVRAHVHVRAMHAGVTSYGDMHTWYVQRHIPPRSAHIYVTTHVQTGARVKNTTLQYCPRACVCVRACVPCVRATCRREGKYLPRIGAANFEANA